MEKTEQDSQDRELNYGEAGMAEAESTDKSQPNRIVQTQTKPERKLVTRMEKGPEGLQAFYVAPSAEAAISVGPAQQGTGDSGGSSAFEGSASDTGQISIAPRVADGKGTSDSADR